MKILLLRRYWLETLFILTAAIALIAFVIYDQTDVFLARRVAEAFGGIWAIVATSFAIRLWIRDIRQERADKAWVRAQDEQRLRKDHIP